MLYNKKELKLLEKLGVDITNDKLLTDLYDTGLDNGFSGVSLTTLELGITDENILSLLKKCYHYRNTRYVNPGIIVQIDNMNALDLDMHFGSEEYKAEMFCSYINGGGVDSIIEQYLDGKDV